MDSEPTQTAETIFAEVFDPPSSPVNAARPVLPDGINYDESPLLVIYKEKRSLELWQQQECIGEYRIGLGSSPTGDKEHEGDGRTPEGAYFVCLKNPSSKFHLSLGLSYPGKKDAENGLASGLISQQEYDQIIRAADTEGTPPWNTALGGYIMIHGAGSQSDWTAGCIALDNDVMDLLWSTCPVGTPVYIYP